MHCKAVCYRSRAGSSFGSVAYLRVRVLKSRGLVCYKPFKRVTGLSSVEARRLGVPGDCGESKVPHACRAKWKYSQRVNFLFFSVRLYSKISGTEAELFEVLLGGQYGVCCQKA